MLGQSAIGQVAIGQLPTSTATQPTSNGGSPAVGQVGVGQLLPSTGVSATYIANSGYLYAFGEVAFGQFWTITISKRRRQQLVL